MDEVVEKTPSIGISYQLTLQNDKRQLVMQSFVERDCSKEELNALLDKMRAAGERQQAYSMVADFNRAIEQEHVNASDQQVRIEKADETLKKEWANGSRRGDLRLTQAQSQRQREAYDTAEAIKLRIARLEKDKLEWEAKIATL